MSTYSGFWLPPFINTNFSNLVYIEVFELVWYSKFPLLDAFIRAEKWVLTAYFYRVRIWHHNSKSSLEYWGFSILIMERKYQDGELIKIQLHHGWVSRKQKREAAAIWLFYFYGWYFTVKDSNWNVAGHKTKAKANLIIMMWQHMICSYDFSEVLNGCEYWTWTN